MKYLRDIGSYFVMITKVFGSFTKRSVLRELIFKEIDDLIIDSLGIVSFISFFVGGVVAIQTALNMTNPLNTGITNWFCYKTIGNTRICPYFYFNHYGG